MTVHVVNTHLVLAEADNVHVDLLLLELLGHLDERRLVHVERRPHEHDNASLVVLVLTVLEGQLRMKQTFFPSIFLGYCALALAVVPPFRT